MQRVSTASAVNEQTLHLTLVCLRYMKLGMQGVTVVYSSGDYGVAGNGGQCCTKAKCAGGTYNTGGSGTFNPSFPGTWYVLFPALFCTF